MEISIYLAIPLLGVAYYYLNKEGRSRAERLRGRNRIKLINRLGFFDEPEQSSQDDFKISKSRDL
ncbi:hypothetical protein HGA34_00955 [Candidatus Falkowbacteria bacterium]|nr:hypothetical protein [Candidatus Falkowbacteria bacterium]